MFFLDQTGNDTIAQFDTDGTLLGAGFEVAQDQIHLITGTGTAQDYSLQDTDQGRFMFWNASAWDQKNGYPHGAAKPMTHRPHWIMW